MPQRGEAPRLERRAESLLQDVRFALRTLRKSWGFTLTGGRLTTARWASAPNTAIFPNCSTLVRLRSLPVANPGTLAGVRIKNGDARLRNPLPRRLLTRCSAYPMWSRCRRHQQSFSGVFAWAQRGLGYLLGEGAQERPGRILWVSGETFSVLGVPPAEGDGCSRRRMTSQIAATRRGDQLSILAERIWRARFGYWKPADNRRPFHGSNWRSIAQVFRPGSRKKLRLCGAVLFLSTLLSDCAHNHSQRLLLGARGGPLKPGVTLEQASSQLEAISPGLIEATLAQRLSTKRDRFGL